MEQQNLLQQVQSLADDLTRAIHDLLAFYLTDDSFLVPQRDARALRVCRSLEAIFLHGVKPHTSGAHSLRSMLHLPHKAEDAPLSEAESASIIWPMLKQQLVTPQTLELLVDAPLANDLSRFRAWIRLAIHDMEQCFRFAHYDRQLKPALESVYKPGAFLLDIERLEIAEGLCKQLEPFKFNLSLSDLLIDPVHSPDSRRRLLSGGASSRTHIPALAGSWDQVAAQEAPTIILASSPKAHKKTKKKKKSTRTVPLSADGAGSLLSPSADGAGSDEEGEKSETPDGATKFTFGLENNTTSQVSGDGSAVDATTLDNSSAQPSPAGPGNNTSAASTTVQASAAVVVAQATAVVEKDQSTGSADAAAASSALTLSVSQTQESQAAASPQGRRKLKTSSGKLNSSKSSSVTSSTASTMSAQPAASPPKESPPAAALTSAARDSAAAVTMAHAQPGLPVATAGSLVVQAADSRAAKMPSTSSADGASVFDSQPTTPPAHAADAAVSYPIVEGLDHPLFDPYSRDMTNYFYHLAPATGLSHQSFQCWTEGCKTPIGGKFEAAMRCHYTGKYYCIKCFRKDPKVEKKVVIPALVIHNLDFTPMPVCIAAAEYLAKEMSVRFVSLSLHAPWLTSVSPQIAEAQALRQDILECLDAVNKCSKYEVVQCIGALSSHANIWIQHDTYSIDDLVAVQTGDLLKKCQKAFADIRKHTNVCEFCTDEILRRSIHS